MSCRLRTVLVLALCALAQSTSTKFFRQDLLDPSSPYDVLQSEPSVTNGPVFIDVNALVYIPQSKTQNEQIVSAELTISGDNPCLFTIIADEMENCTESTSGPCQSPNKWPEVIVTLVGVVNNGEPYTYNVSVTGGTLLLTIYMGSKLTFVPKYNPDPTTTTIYLNFMAESFQRIYKSSNSSDVFVNVQTLFTPTSPTTNVPYSGQPDLCPLRWFLLLMLLVVCFIN
ncbi:uncharacterized protein RB166_020481 [Leptodactylus fuscus]|uniref:uncharacterized protein LOC142184201 n=1 Tax=Leptodactylus fuscus TaxID=238119 RepID=UPI003F4E9CD5